MFERIRHLNDYLVYVLVTLSVVLKYLPLNQVKQHLSASELFNL